MTLTRKATRRSLGWNASACVATEVLETRRLLSGDPLVELEAALSGDTAAVGEAEFQVEAVDGVNETKFEVEVIGAVAGSTHVVSVGGVQVGQVVIEADGRGELEFTSDVDDADDQPFPANWPEVAAGTVIEVGSILSGTLAVSGDDGDDGDDDEDKNQPELEAHLVGIGSEFGKVEYEGTPGADPTGAKFEVEVFNATPGASYSVFVDNVDVGTLTIGVFGAGELEYETQFPANWPGITASSVVRVGDILQSEVSSNELDGRLTGPGDEFGTVEYEESAEDNGLEVEFEVEVYRATPGSTYAVFIDDQQVGQITIGTTGRGKLELTSDADDEDELPLPANWPTVTSASVIRVGDILQGSLGDLGLNEFQLDDRGDVDDYIDVHEIESDEDGGAELRTQTGELLAKSVGGRISFAGFEPGTYQVWVNGQAVNHIIEPADDFGDTSTEPDDDPLDVDGSGEFDFSDDGIILLAFALGSRGESLADFSSGAIRNGAEIEDHLEKLASALDMDGDGAFQFANDGVIMLAFALGSRGDDLEAFRSDDASRDGALIEARLKQLNLVTSTVAARPAVAEPRTSLGTANLVVTLTEPGSTLTVPSTSSRLKQQSIVSQPSTETEVAEPETRHVDIGESSNALIGEEPDDAELDAVFSTDELISLT